MKKTKKIPTRINVYDYLETTQWIDPKKRLRFADLGLKLPDMPPTQVISIRLPSGLLNQIRAIGSQRDVPYQVLIKLILSDAVAKMRKKAA